MTQRGTLRHIYGFFRSSPIENFLYRTTLKKLKCVAIVSIQCFHIVRVSVAFCHSIVLRTTHTGGDGRQ